MNKIVVEFSLSQKCFHRYTVDEMLFQNQRNMMQRKQTDFLPIAIFETIELADEFIELTRDMIKDYPLYESFNGSFIVGQ